MRKDSLTFGNASEFAGKVSIALRRRFPVKTAEAVAAAVPGVKADQARKWLPGLVAPSAPAFLNLCFWLGPDFLAEIMPERLGWLEAASRAQRQHALEAEQQRIERQLTDLRI